MTNDLDTDLSEIIRAVPGWADERPAVALLTQGITNRNFRVDVGGRSFVVRVPGRETSLLGIDRDAERAAATAAATAGVGPEVVAFLPAHGALVTRFLHARPLAAGELERRDSLRQVVESVRAIHGMGPLPCSFDPFRVVREYRRIAGLRGVGVPPAFDEALAVADRIEAALDRRPRPRAPCHNDLLNANFLVADGRVFVVDYEYAGMGDPFFDLGNLSVNNGLSEDAEALLLELYFGRAELAHVARLKLMQIMSDFREAMWGVVQQALSTLDFDYVSYADRHFLRCLRTAGQRSFGAWLDDAAKEP